MAVPRPRPAVRRTILALLVLAVLAAVWFLYYGGRYLQHEDPLQKADAIFVLAGTRAERPLEAIDLYKEGYAPIVVLSPGNVEHAKTCFGRAVSGSRGRTSFSAMRSCSPVFPRRLCSRPAATSITRLRRPTCSARWCRPAAGGESSS